MRSHLVRVRLLLVTTIAGVAGATILGGQARPAVTHADYGKFESLVTQPRGGLSPDGRWLAYGINRSNRENELRVAPVAAGETKTIPFGSQAAFSADSRWVAYAIGYSESQEEKLRQQKKPIQRKLGTLELASGVMTTVDGIETFAFNASGSHLAMKRYAPEPKSPPDASAAEEAPVGGTLIVRHLATGQDTAFGNVTEFTWQEKGPMLALAIGADDKTGNGVQLYDPDTGSLRVLDSAAAIYSGLTWRKDANDLMVLRSATDDRHEGPTQVLLAWPALGPTVRYDPTSVSGFPAGTRIVSFRRPSWSDDGRTVFVGVARWEEKPKTGARGGDKPGDHGTASPTDKKEDTKEPEEPAAVEVWHARDVDVMPRQKINARTDRQRNTLAAWHVDTNRFVPLGTDLFERVTPLRRQRLAYAANWSSYAMERTIGRPAADVYLVDIDTGARTKVKDAIDDQTLQASPGGRYLLYLQADQYWTIDTTTRAVVSISKAAATSFVNRESDATVKQKPPFGVAGWTKHDEAVILYDKFDAWRVAANGSGAARLTDGSTDQLRHRYVRLDPDEEWIDASQPIHFSLFGIWSKRSGYARLDPGAGAVTPLVVEGKSITGLAKAKDAGVYAYTVQAFDDPPDVMVGGPSLQDARAVARTNPFAVDYAWGTSEVIEYKNERGERLQGALFYPPGYQPGRK